MASTAPEYYHRTLKYPTGNIRYNGSYVEVEHFVEDPVLPENSETPDKSKWKLEWYRVYLQEPQPPGYYFEFDHDFTP